MLTCSLLIAVAMLSRSPPVVFAAKPRPESVSTDRAVDLLRSASASCASTRNDDDDEADDDDEHANHFWFDVALGYSWINLVALDQRAGH